MDKGFLKHLYDFIGIPLRFVLFPDSWCERFGLTSLEKERIGAVLPHVRGRLLDIGCGNNRLVRAYGNGVGVDIYNWSDDVVVVDDSASIVMDSSTFDTITFLACLNHIPNREAVIREAGRLLKDDGQVIVTMINPLLGTIGHKIWWYGEEKKRGMQDGERYGLWNHEIIRLFEKNGFALDVHRRFVYWMNNLFVFNKK
jgi:SAM-dependent methyltransferase